MRVTPITRSLLLTETLLALRYIKLRTSCGRNLIDLALGINRNPLRRAVEVNEPSEDYTTEILESFKEPLNLQCAFHEPIIKDRLVSGWLVWGTTDERFLAPAPNTSTFQPWEPGSAGAVEIVRRVCCDPEYWNAVATYFAEETSQETLTMDNISATKSICKSMPPFSYRPFS